MNTNKHRKPEDRVVSWGRYKRKKFKNVPTEYLEWFVANGYKQMKNRIQWAKEELERRSKKGDQQ